MALLCSRLRQVGKGRGLLRLCQAYGFHDMGVFLDWASLYQKDPALFDPKETPEAKLPAERAAFIAELHARTKHYGGADYEASRTEEELAAFRRALHQTMSLWYGHSKTTVVLLTEFPEELFQGFEHTRSYESRGWTTFERCLSELGKQHSMRFQQWSLVIDVKNVQTNVPRQLPTTPAKMAELLKTRQFTNGADHAVVLKLYEQTAMAILGGVKFLDFGGVQLNASNEERSPQRLARSLDFCESLEELNMYVVGLTDELLKTLADELPPGALPRLKKLRLGFNYFGAKGIEAIGGMLAAGSIPRLDLLELIAPQEGEAMAIALASVLMSLPTDRHPRLVMLIFSNVGSAGALALSAAITATGSTSRFLLLGNPIPLRARVALVRARDSTNDGSDLLEIMISQIFNGLIPRFFIRGIGPGIFLHLRNRRRDQVPSGSAQISPEIHMAPTEDPSAASSRLTTQMSMRLDC